MVNGTLLNFSKRYKDNLWVIFDQWPKLHLGLDVENSTPSSYPRFNSSLHWSVIPDNVRKWNTYHVIPNQYILCLNESFQVKDITKLKNLKDLSEAVNGSLYMVSLPGTSLAVHSALWCTYFQFFSKFHGLKYCLYLLFHNMPIKLHYLVKYLGQWDIKYLSYSGHCCQPI